MCNIVKKNKIVLSEALIRIKKDLKKRKKKNVSFSQLSQQEKKLIEEINDRTTELNKNNVTRTEAYLDFYKRNPEIQWSFLAHMVSRNAGWNMTDLKGGQLSHLLSIPEAESFFSFLERGNWLIFQDAYPQLLVYEASKLTHKNLFHLLPYFNVSLFMEAIWNNFWIENDLDILAVAQIINEQSHIEERVVKNEKYQKEVVNSFEFKLQDLLTVNQILFPYNDGKSISLFGQSLHQFESLHERIVFGKKLYSLLYSNNHSELVLAWASHTPHTGSRKDYWSHIFNDINDVLPGKLLRPRIQNCKLTPGSGRIYSPRLKFAWKNSKQKRAEEGDWYNNWRVIEYLVDPKPAVKGEIKLEYCKTLEKIELAVLAKKVISKLD